MDPSMEADIDRITLGTFLNNAELFRIFVIVSPLWVAAQIVEVWEQLCIISP